MSVDISQEAHQKYIERRRLDLESCKNALDKKDFEILARIAHQIKGNASTFGYDELKKIAMDMEKQALAKDSKKLLKVLFRFSKFILQP